MKIDSHRFLPYVLPSSQYAGVYIAVFPCLKNIQMNSFSCSVFSLNMGKCGPEQTPYLDTFRAIVFCYICCRLLKKHQHKQEIDIKCV